MRALVILVILACLLYGGWQCIAGPFLDSIKTVETSLHVPPR